MYMSVWFAESPHITVCVLIALMLSSLLSTLYISTLAAVERFLFIAQPFLHLRVFTRQRMVLYLLLCWAVAIVVSGIGVSRDLAPTHGGKCQTSINRDAELYIVLPSVLLSLTLAGAMYGGITRVALRHQAEISSRTLPLSAPSAKADPAELQWFTKKLRAGRMFGVVYAVFFYLRRTHGGDPRFQPHLAA